MILIFTIKLRKNNKFPSNVGCTRIVAMNGKQRKMNLSYLITKLKKRWDFGSWAKINRVISAQGQ